MKKIIGIAWKFWAGKSLVAEYLRDKLDLQVFEGSDVLKQEAKVRGIKEPTRENLIDIAEELQKKYGKQIIFEKLLETIDEKWIIPWIRLIEQAKYLRENSDFTLIYMDSSDDRVFERVLKRNKFWDPVNAEEFSRIWKRDWQSDLEKLKNYADLVIENNGSLEDLYKKLDIFIKDY